MWTNTARSSNSAARESTFRSDIQRHLVLERFSTSCSAFACAATGAEETRESATSARLIGFMAPYSPFVRRDTALDETPGFYSGRDVGSITILRIRCTILHGYVTR